MKLKTHSPKALEKSKTTMKHHGTMMFAYLKDLVKVLGTPDVQKPMMWLRETSSGTPFVLMEKGENTGQEAEEWFFISGSESDDMEALNEIGKEGERLGII
jgi:hypothetical protein